MAIQIDRAIFLHIPKTGGTWVTSYFRETGMSHNVEDLEFEAHINGKVIRKLRPNTEDLCFCFIRHPLTWYRSYWQMRNFLDPTRNSIGGIALLDNLVDLPFHDYIRALADLPRPWLTDFFNDYTELCRLIGKQENLRHDLDNILNLLKIPYDRNCLYTKPNQNESKPTITYTNELANLIMNKEEEIIKKFNYGYIPSGVVDV